MRRLASIFFFSALLCSRSAHADTFTYYVNDVYSSFSVNGTITTNINSGTIFAANITAFSLTTSDGTRTELLNTGNSRVSLSGTALTASVTGLNFNYASTSAGLLLLQLLGAHGTDYLCYQDAATGCDDFDSAHESVSVGSDSQRVQTFTASRMIASATPPVVTPPVAVTPEPGTLALLSTGVLCMAGVLRKRITALA